MRKLLVLFITLSTCLPSCSLFDQMSVDRRVRKVEIGMTEKEVIRIMGRSYEIVGASGNMRIINYPAPPDYEYRFRFVGGRLESFAKERTSTHPQNNRPQHPDNRRNDNGPRR